MVRATQPAASGEAVTGGLCVLLSIVMLLLPDSAQIQLAHALSSVLVNPWLEVRNFGEDVLRVRAENTRLGAQVQVLELRLAAERRQALDREREAGPALAGGFELPVAPCQVTARKRARLATMIQIRSLEPLDWRPEMPVITPQGFLGRLHTIIGPQAAWVELLSAPDMALGVEFERTGLVGVLRPRGSRFVVELVGRDEDVQPGDLVITAGIAEVREERGGPVSDPVPRGLRVGVVQQVSAPSEQIFKEITVQPLADFRYNETVFVVGAGPLAAGAGGGAP
jgi:hypothetical protein